MLWRSTSGYIRYSERISTSVVPATHYCWCKYAKVRAITMSSSSSTIWWWDDETYRDWWEACSRTTPDAATVKYKTQLLSCMCPLKTIIRYQFDAWSWIRIWVNAGLKLYISEYGKVLHSSSLHNDNGEFNLLRSLEVTKAICAEEKEGCMGFVGQRSTLMQCMPSIVIIHRLLVPQSISGEWKNFLL